MKKYSFSFFLLMILGLQLNAQEFKTDQSIGAQLKNNAQPGMKYAPAVSAAARNKPASANRTRTAATSPADLPSNKSAAEARQQMKSSQKPPVAQSIPSQDGEQGANAPQPAATGTRKQLPVKKIQQ